MCEPALADFIEDTPCAPETRFALPFRALFCGRDPDFLLPAGVCALS